MANPRQDRRRPTTAEVAGWGEDAASALVERAGIAEVPVDIVTPALFTAAIGKAAFGALRRPVRLASAGLKMSAGAVAAAQAAMARTTGPLAPAPGDRRFEDPTWQQNPLYGLIQQLYLLECRFLDEMVDIAALDGEQARKARFAAHFLGDLLAPTNTLLGNPQALRRAFETGGDSVKAGLANLLHDVRHNGGWPTQVDTSGFEVGHNMATTRGKVVYRSPLIELIQYEPTTPTVHSVPLLLCPPWINKYYILDLAPGRSLVEWAVGHGHTCFAISYRNPSAEMRDTTFDDYLIGGPLDAVRVVKEITGSPTVNTLSVCLGGTLTAMAMAYSAADGDKSIQTATLINAHTDFTQPGLLGNFTDEATIRGIERRMEKKGYLEASEMARTFDMLRANDLIFQYVAKNWLMGETPPKFDLLAWNNDATRMPAKMHARYLNSCFLGNEFARGEFVVNGRRLDPGLVRAETYVVSAEGDHIVPWQSAYRTTQLLGGHNRFVLAGSGHIAGIVSPPSPKAKHWTNPATPPDPMAWREKSVLHAETWWEDWARWIKPRAGRKVKARIDLGSAEHPPLCDAPGTYVVEIPQ